MGGRVVLNEIPLQFAMLPGPDDLVDRYLAFSYPYGVRARIADIRKKLVSRRVEGIIHYTQSFCHRQIHDILIRDAVNIPVLTLEGENPGECDSRARLRLESFLEILLEKQQNL